MIKSTLNERIAGIVLICIGLILILIGVHLAYTLNNSDYIFISMSGVMPFIFLGILIGYPERGVW